MSLNITSEQGLKRGIKRGLKQALKPQWPADVRLMNAVSTAIFVLAALVLFAAGLLWLGRSNALPLRAIALEGELLRTNPNTLRASAMPRLQGNFLGLDLQAARSAFESVPWVRRAVVRRIWPDRLAVRLEEHQPVARWELEDAPGSDRTDRNSSSAERLVNVQGEVFDANLGDVEDDNLPLLAGPEGSAAQMLALQQQLVPLFDRIDRDLLELRLSSRGSWRAELDSDLTVELGRGTPAELLARCERFVNTLAQVNEHFKAPLLYADLRHPDGYAVRMRGVTTHVAASAATARNP